MIDSRVATKVEKFNYHNSLVALVKAVENSYTTIDLRNESCVTGKVVSVDGFMNLELTNAVYYDSKGNEHLFENFFVLNRNIRYVHMPKGTTCKDLLKNQINTLQNPRKLKEDRKGTLKYSRAKQYNEETIHEAYKSNI